jgi:hypothetical protein
MDTFDEMNRKLTYEGKIVLSVEPMPHGQKLKKSNLHKKKTERSSFSKIDLADEILVLNVGGYIGERPAGR